MSRVLFEVSWEVANPIGGIHTVLASKAPTMVGRHGDDYIAVGPMLGDDRPRETPFEEEEGFEAFQETCREAGVEVRVGRWRISGMPRAILVGFSGLFEKKDEVLAELWGRFGVDSLFGKWDYVEPVFFSHAAGIVIERWWQEFVAPRRVPAVAHFHSWLTGAGLLYVKEHVPALGTVFTTHSTVLGRTLAGMGEIPVQGLGTQSPDSLAQDLNIRSKHSIEGVASREADVFTTVSPLVADEARLFHARDASPLLPNGLDLGVLDELADSATFEEVRERLRRLTWALTGEDPGDALFASITGRYELHNKGIDLLLQALADLAEQPGREIVLFLFVYAETTGLRRDLRDRMEADAPGSGEPLGLATHDLVDPDEDPLHRLAASLGLDNRAGRRVKLVHVPVHLSPRDDLFQLPRETILKGMDLTCHVPYYEPWGYPPAESLALGVPAITTDCAGFGLWVLEQGLTSEDGVRVLARLDRSDADALGELVGMIEAVSLTAPDRERIAMVCRQTADQLAWAKLVQHYAEAHARALEVAGTRHATTPLEPPRRRVPLEARRTEESRRPRLVPFRVATRLPAPLADLARLARNLWWTWDADARSLFREIGPELWDAFGKNPIVLLERVLPERLQDLAQDDPFLERMAQVVARFDAYLDGARDEAEIGDDARVDRKHPIAYFCFEYALHASMHGYAGGLGVLAADHVKSASDLALPFVAVGLLYRGGYAHQEIGAGGEPVSRESPDDPADLPLSLVRDADAKPVQVTVGLPDRRVTLQIWRADVGRVPLYLLDADVPENRPEDRLLTRRLYGGGRELRLVQEILLGKGGVRALTRLGIEPAVLHMNEGHAGFAPLERVAHLVHDQGLAPDEAWSVVRATTAFTTHTPVPAGHDVFGEDLLRRYFGQTPAWTGLSWERFLALGRAPGETGDFNMTYFSMSFASWINGVSRKHGEVSRALLQAFWPGLLRSELPIHSITNGVHLPTWTGREMAQLVGARGRAVEGADFRRADDLTDEAIWEARCAMKRTALERLRKRVGRKLPEDALREDALYITFARRFSPYKRPGLLLEARDRLVALLRDEERPVRFLYAGKAHPKDGHGQDLVRRVAEAGQDPDLRGRFLFLPGYGLDLAHDLVELSDVWMNHPIPPLEASGTSGMKAAANGGLNLSGLDGWWIEGYDGENGWALDPPPVGIEPRARDELDASAILSLLREEVVPSFFGRDEQGVPRDWIRRVRHNLKTLPPEFDTGRMVAEYVERAYAPLARSHGRLSASRYATGRALAARQRHLRDAMKKVKIVATRVGDLAAVGVGDWIETEVDLQLGTLGPTDVVVELVLGHGVDEGTSHYVVHRLDARGAVGGDVQRFAGRAPLVRAGRLTYGLRVRPREASPWDLMLHRLVRWS